MIDMRIDLHGTIAVLTAKSVAGKQWIEDNVCGEEFFRDGVVVGRELTNEVIDKADTAGLSIEVS